MLAYWVHQGMYHINQITALGYYLALIRSQHWDILAPIFQKHWKRLWSVKEVLQGQQFKCRTYHTWAPCTWTRNYMGQLACWKGCWCGMHCEAYKKAPQRQSGCQGYQHSDSKCRYSRWYQLRTQENGNWDSKCRRLVWIQFICKKRLWLKALGALRVWNQKWLFFTTRNFFKRVTGQWRRLRNFYTLQWQDVFVISLLLQLNLVAMH